LWVPDVCPGPHILTVTLSRPYVYVAAILAVPVRGSEVATPSSM
jgi:hypothetical protein